MRNLPCDPVDVTLRKHADKNISWTLEVGVETVMERSSPDCKELLPEMFTQVLIDRAVRRDFLGKDRGVGDP